MDEIEKAWGELGKATRCCCAGAICSAEETCELFQDIVAPLARAFGLAVLATASASLYRGQLPTGQPQHRDLVEIIRTRIQALGA